MLKNKYKIILSLFSEGEGSSTGTDGANDGAGATEGSGGGAAGGTKEPFATFPDEKSFMNRMNREAKKQMTDLLKTMGLDNEDALKTILAEKKSKEDADKTELQKLQDKITAAENATKTATEKANIVLKNSEAKILGLSLGVKPERMDYLVKLLDLETISIVEGEIDKDALKTQIEKILVDMPELKGTAAGSASGKAGGDFKGGQNVPLSWDLIKKMKPIEAKGRMTEIREFMKNNPQ